MGAATGATRLTLIAPYGRRLEETAMSVVTRRQVLSHSASALALAASGLASRGALAAMGPNDKFDLLIKGGEVLDPSQSLRAKRDVGIRYGLIEALEADIPADKALKVLSAS